LSRLIDLEADLSYSAAGRLLSIRRSVRIV
jgi:hypothetical protein